MCNNKQKEPNLWLRFVVTTFKLNVRCGIQSTIDVRLCQFVTMECIHCESKRCHLHIVYKIKRC